MLHFRLRYRQHDIELNPGEFVIGRSEQCQLSIDDAMISRRHVALRVTVSEVVLVDLGSRNGVSLNGIKLKGEKALSDADKFTIGKHELTLTIFSTDSKRNKSLLARTLGPLDIEELDYRARTRTQPNLMMADDPGFDETPPPPRPDPSGLTPSRGLARALSSFITLAPLADKALALGRHEEAERLLSGPLGDLITELRKGGLVELNTLTKFAGYAVKLASLLLKAAWIEWVFEAFLLTGYMMPAPMIDELFNIVPRLKHLEKRHILDYITGMQATPSLSATDRFLVQRLETLTKRLATVR